MNSAKNFIKAGIVACNRWSLKDDTEIVFVKERIVQLVSSENLPIEDVNISPTMAKFKANTVVLEKFREGNFEIMLGYSEKLNQLAVRVMP